MEESETAEEAERMSGMVPMEDPVFRWGERVVAAVDLRNDGSFSGVGADEVVEPRGAEGEVVRIGFAPESRQIVYLVEFGDGRVVGCFEEELSSRGSDGSPAGPV